MTSIFTQIIKGDIPSYKILEDSSCLAFLDISPLSRGHVLVVPKQEIDYIFDIDTEEYIRLWNFAKKVAKGMKEVLECKRIGIAVIGLEVPHTHIHLVPINDVKDINFTRPKLSFSKQEMENIARLIQEAI
ncbi:MAG: HIT family protein [Bacteroidota bacterium]|nr:HIT family protein [Bacteroidota bacterium]